MAEMPFTGERFVASLDSPEIAYEHWHRYLFAAGLVRGKRVLDVASGEGYGSALLAGSAAEVVGVDVSAEAVAFARERYPASNLRFLAGSAGAIPVEGTACFDAVVSFETIEHVPADVQAAFLAEVKRLLVPGGLLVISTPNKLVYSDQPGYRNQFHLREFRADEFRAFLRERFHNVEFLGQRVFSTSALWTLDRPTALAPEFRLEHGAGGFRPTGRPLPDKYLVALCSDGALPDVSGSLLVDLDDRLQREGWEKAPAEALRAQAAELAAARERATRLEAAAARLAEQIRGSSAGVAADALMVARRAAATRPGRPLVSIVIPVWNKVDYTRRCLEKIIENTPGDLFEVVVVDNASTDGTAELLASMEGDAKVVKNPRNEGFVLACNQGAAASDGKYVLFLNNDTAPQPGWLEALVAEAERDPRVGAVGAKLVYPDGNLQEAGGIVFSDASGWNFGKGDDPERPAYQEPCEVDYCSGAVLLVRKDLFDRLGGFDLRYAPAYYEDTDLCFGLRSLGFQVRYCPTSVVIHHEGVTAGTSTASGPKRFQDVNRDKFFQKWREELRRQPEPPSVTGRTPRTASRERVLAAAADKGSVLVVDPTMPLFDRASGSLRLFRILQLLRADGFHVTYLARNGTGQHAYRRPLTDMGIRVLDADPERMAQLGYYVAGPRADLGQILGERPFDVAWLSFFYIAEQYLPLVRGLSPRTAVVADTVDVHYLRELREAELRRDPAVLARARQLRERELAVYQRADLVLTVTAADREELLRRKLATPVEVVPNVHAPHQGPTPGFDARGGMIFVGGFGHPPNVDAMTSFCAEILPRIRERAPGLPLAIVGSNPPEEVRALAGADVAVTGWVPDTGPLLDGARVSVAPLRYGAGMKGKIGEALGRGLPVVTTSVGAEGMGLVDGESALIADGPRAFAEAVVRLHGDRELWERLREGGRRALQPCAPETVAASLRSIVERARAGGLRREPRPTARSA